MLVQSCPRYRRIEQLFRAVAGKAKIHVLAARGTRALAVGNLAYGVSPKGGVGRVGADGRECVCSQGNWGTAEGRLLQPGSRLGARSLQAAAARPAFRGAVPLLGAGLLPSPAERSTSFWTLPVW